MSRYAASLVGLPAAGEERWAVVARALLPMARARPFFPDLGDRPPELPLLAVRAARRALAANPDDANAWLRLGQAYLALHGLTGERPHEGPPGPAWQLLVVLRHVQAATALEHALLLDTDLEPAHRALARLYAERAFFDAALEHSREVVRLDRRRRTSDKEEEHEARLAHEEKGLDALEQLVGDRKNQYAVQASPLTANPLARAQLAVSLGLPRVALDDVLLQSHVKLFGGDGARLEFELLLLLGRPEHLRVMIEDEELRQSKQLLGESTAPAPALPGYRPFYRLPAYEWLRLGQAAAAGDYAAADSSLREILRRREEEEQRVKRLEQALPPLLATEIGLSAPGGPLFPRATAHETREDLCRLLSSAAFLPLERADLNALGGLLALERGAPGAAEEYFREALAAAGPRAFAAQTLTAAYLRRLRAARGR
jgi:tetratricopeptide (TPR) repeat protein